MIDRKTIDDVIDRAKIYDIVSDDIELKRQGSLYVGLCPFHDDHSPSFYVSPTKNICKCFVCGNGGTPITYYQKKNGVSFTEAVKAIGRRYDIEIREKDVSDEERADILRHEHLTALNERVFEYYRGKTPENADVVSYVTKRFGEDFLKKFDVGYASDDRTQLVRWATERNESMEELKELGWIKTNRYSGGYEDKLKERIIFPIRNVYGNIVGYTARTVSKDANIVKHYKYINSPDSWLYHKSEYVFGLDTAKITGKSRGIMYLVEGACDALKMLYVGIENTVASLGCEWTDDMLSLIRRYTNTICFINDADDHVCPDWGKD